MAYRILIINFYFGCLFFLTVKCGFGQNCKITEVAAIPFLFSDTSTIDKIYKSMKSDTSNKSQILLVRLFSQMKIKEAYYLSIGSLGEMTATAILSDSILFSDSISKKAKGEKINRLNDTIKSGFFMSDCQNVISSHTKSILVFGNYSKGQWFEYTSLDGYMREALNENKNLTYLNQVYKLVTRVFKDLNLFKE